MGGLRKKIPITATVLCCARCAIAGFPFSGCCRKDLILEAAYRAHPLDVLVGLLTAFMTAFYVFRALFLAFFGDYRGTSIIRTNPRSSCGPRWPFSRCSRWAAAISACPTGSSRCSPCMKRQWIR